MVGLLHNSKELSTNLAGLSTFSYFFAVFIKNIIYHMGILLSGLIQLVY